MSSAQQPALPRAGSDIFGEYGPGVTCAAAVFLLLVVAAIDKLTGYELRLQILYLVPIALTTWAAGRSCGLLASAASIGIWLAMFRHGHGYSTSLYFYWDAAVTLAMFAVFVLLIDRLRLELQSSNERLLEVLEDLDAAVYVADPVQGKVLFGNRHFRETLEERPYESLGALAAKECSMLWPDGRRVLLRIVTH